jgi:DNA-binding XRE family transcriptional regulator
MASQNPRLKQAADVGRLVTEGRRRAKLSQEEFASRVGISRKTLSDLERGVADHVSLKTAIKALLLAGFALEAAPRRPPTLSEVMAQRAEHQARVDRLDVVLPPASPKDAATAKNGVLPRRRVPAGKKRRR